MTEKDLNILKDLAEEFEKGNDEGMNYLSSDTTTYTESEYDELEKVNGEHRLIMLVYNIKRSINILGVPDLIAKLQAWNTP